MNFKDPQEQIYGYVNVRLNNEDEDRLYRVLRVLNVDSYRNAIEEAPPYTIYDYTNDYSYINKLEDIINIPVNSLEGQGYDYFPELELVAEDDKTSTLETVIKSILSNYEGGEFCLVVQVIGGGNFTEFKTYQEKIIISNNKETVHVVNEI